MASCETIQTIAQLGDLILELGTSKKKILVSSTVLITLSKVFAALLGPNFKEGQVERDVKEPQFVSLADDYEGAMTHMCMLLHSQAVPEFSNPGEYAETLEMVRNETSVKLLCLAKTIDKYDCVDVLRLQVNALLWDFLDRFEYGKTDTCRIANAAWLLQLPRAFRAATKQILREHSAFPSLKKSELPARVYYALQHRYFALQEFMRRDLSKILIGDWSCSCEDVNKHDLQDFLDDYEPGTTLSPSFIIKSLPKHIGTQRLRCKTCDVVDYDEVEAYIEEVERICKGLCLHCLQSHEVEDPLNNCSITDHIC